MNTRTQPSTGPYTGPRAFGRWDQSIFFGRDREADRLIALIIAHPAVLLYAPTGAGKSSLLNAQIIPRLEKEEEFEALPLARMNIPRPSGIDYEEVENIYVFNTLLSWDKNNTDPRKLASMSLSMFLESRAKLGDRVPRIAVFDQFEEFFTTYPERWEERQEFFNQVCDALDDRFLRALFSVREDCLAGMESYAQALPEQLRTRFRLERLRRDSALQAVTAPVKAAGFYFESGAAEQLVENLVESFHVKTSSGEVITKKGVFVDPLQLQIVCQGLWQSLRPGESVITRERLKESGDVNCALESFYEDTLRAAEEAVGVKESLLRRWFESELITPEGTRAVVLQGLEKTGSIPNAAAMLFEDQHLIKSEYRGGTCWYELIHDRFIDIIRESNKRWFNSSYEERFREWLEAQANRWLELNMSSTVLLTRSELLEAEKWIAGQEADAPDYSSSILSLIEASRRANRERSLRRSRYFLIGASLLLTIMVLVVLVVVNQRKKAEMEQQNAESMRSEAQRQKEGAERALAIAEAAEEDAKKQESIAKDALRAAVTAKLEAEGQRKIADSQKRIAFISAQQNKELERKAQSEAERYMEMALEAQKQKQEKEQQLRLVTELNEFVDKTDSGYWEAIKNETNPAFFRAYLNMYPKGKHSSEARKRAGISLPETETKTVTVIGRINDLDTLTPISGVTVVARHNETGQEITAITSENGTYIMQLSAGSYTITASREGYEKELNNNVRIVSGDKQVTQPLTGLLKRIP